MPVSGSSSPWAEQLSNQLNHRHSLIPPVPPIPSMYSSQNLARPAGRPPGAFIPRTDRRFERRQHTPTSSSRYHYDIPDFDRDYTMAAADGDGDDSALPYEDLYSASPVGNRRAPSTSFSSSRNRPPTPTRIPSPEHDLKRAPGLYSPTLRKRAGNVRAMVRTLSGEFDESEATVTSDFDRSSATVSKSELDATSMSDTIVEDDADLGKLDFTDYERPRDPVGRSKAGKEYEKVVKKPFFFSKAASSSPSYTTIQGQANRTLRHQNSFFNLKKSTAKNVSRHSLDSPSSLGTASPAKTGQNIGGIKVAPAVGGKTNNIGSKVRPTLFRGPKPSRSMFNLRQKSQTPTPLPIVISAPMDAKHVSGSGTAFEEVMNRSPTQGQASHSHLNKSVTSAQLNGRSSPLHMTKSATAVHFSDQTPTPRLAKSSTAAQIDERGNAVNVAEASPPSPTLVVVEGITFVMCNPPVSAKKSSVPPPRMTKSSTAAKISSRVFAPSMTKSSTSAQLNGRSSVLGRWAKRSSPVPTDRITGDRLKISIGAPSNVVHFSGSGTALESVQSRTSLTLVPTGIAVQDGPEYSVSAPFNVSHVSSSGAALREAMERSNSSLQVPSEQSRSFAPAFSGGRDPRPNSKSRNPFKRSAPSTISISSPFNPSHVSGDGTAFEEVMGKSTPVNSGGETSANKISPRRYQSMQDIRTHDVSTPGGIPSPIYENAQGRNFTTPVLPSHKKENIPPSKAHRLLGTISPARIQTKPSNLPLPKSRTFGKLSSLSSSWGRSVVNLAARNHSTHSLIPDSITSLHAEPTTFVSNTTATAEPTSTPARPVSPLQSTSDSSPTMVYEADYDWSGMFSTLRDKYMQEFMESTMRDPKTMQKFQSREESQKKKKKKGKNSDNPFRDDEDAGTVGIDNLLTEEEFCWKRIFVTLESRAIGGKAKQSLWKFQEEFANNHNAAWLLPARCKPPRDEESSGGFMARVRGAISRKD
ncbi:hypothetical protein IFR05_015550 [Cadophora sp. M221]|nr:hypothetical protein IFR05_015550 [Cadophora sp. M221]